MLVSEFERAAHFTNMKQIYKILEYVNIHQISIAEFLHVEKPSRLAFTFEACVFPW